MDQDYLRPCGSGTIDQKAKLFQLRGRMLPLKANFKNGKEDIMCSLCDEGEETQTHLLTYSALCTNSVISSDTTVPGYEDIHAEVLGVNTYIIHNCN